jgi:hypothetical protein
LIESALTELSKAGGAGAGGKGSKESFELVFAQLKAIGEELKKYSGGSGIDVDKMVKLEEARAGDLQYLMNKTEELKAMLEMSKKMVDNVANKPVTQTWYEFG